jgi:hypothetical protein
MLDRIPPQTAEWQELSRSRRSFKIAGANELVTFHGNGDFKFRSPGSCRLKTSQDLPQTANSNRGMAARERNQVFDTPTNLHVCMRQETDAAGTDVAGFLLTVHPLIAQLDDLQRQLKFVSISTSLFQELYSIEIPERNQ